MLGTVACYFIDQGDSRNAYIAAEQLATALQLSLSMDAEHQVLRFRTGTRVVQLSITDNIRDGLEIRSNTLQVVGGRHVDSPSGIRVGSTVYVAIAPIVRAFGWNSAWDATQRAVTIDTLTSQTITSQIEDLISSDMAAPQDSSSRLDAPRVGVHEGFTRIVLDLPRGSSYQISNSDDQIIIRLPGLQADGFSYQGNAPHVRHVRYSQAGGVLALVVDSNYPLAGGEGFVVGTLPANADSPQARVFIDIGPAATPQDTAANLVAQELPEWHETEARAEALVPNNATETEDSDISGARAPGRSRRTVIIDPGHGGRFSGAQGYVREEIVVLDIALKLRDLLEQAGINVIMTRTANTHLSEIYSQDLAARTNFATSDHNFFISIHANSAEASSANGVETWVFGQPLDARTREQAIRENGGGSVGRIATDEAISFANSMFGDILAQEQLHYSRMLAESVQSQLVTRTNARDRGVKQSAFQVLRQSRIPAILVEVGFVTHPQEGPRLADRAYQTRVAEGIASGVLDFFERGGSLANR